VTRPPDPKLCARCKKRPAVVRVRGSKRRRRRVKYKRLKDHDLCRQCWQSLEDRVRARTESRG
jgi:hypothetical protein